MKPLVTFDCYGTLIDWEGGMRAALGAAPDGFTDRYIAIEMEVERAYRPYRDVLRIALERTLAESGLPGDPRAFAESIRRWPPFPETRDALERLRAAGLKLAILSNVDNDIIAESVRLIGVPFDWIVTAQDVGSYKPAPGHWRRIRELAPDARLLHVGASALHDIRPARALGLRSVWINRKAEPASLCEPDAMLPDLRGLPAEIPRILSF